MTDSDSRYYQPKNTKDAMRYVEGLFNKYKDAPLTDALMQYHRKLVYYLRTNVASEAVEEGYPDRQKKALAMADVMDQWLQAKLLGKPFTGKMQGFKMTSGQRTKYHVDQGRRKNRQKTIRKGRR
ncbi:hypothetical protein ACFQ5M_13160 [Agrilactobacillus yilanensis]|uniref:Terminase small subunit n=1 Tax=Agrilactobacillus yilanensis TaxID=2485997 RepID=A0ABW4J9H8_9LACO|nr:hypothetical protein [Agrilactobacillus yilanensis]